MGCMGLWPIDGSCIGTIIPLNANIPQIMTKAVCWALGIHGLLSKEDRKLLHFIPARCSLGAFDKVSIGGRVHSPAAADRVCLIPGHLLPAGEIGC